MQIMFMDVVPLLDVNLVLLHHPRRLTRTRPISRASAGTPISSYTEVPLGICHPALRFVGGYRCYWEVVT